MAKWTRWWPIIQVFNYLFASNLFLEGCIHQSIYWYRKYLLNLFPYQSVHLQNSKIVYPIKLLSLFPRVDHIKKKGNSARNRSFSKQITWKTEQPCERHNGVHFLNRHLNFQELPENCGCWLRNPLRSSVDIGTEWMCFAPQAYLSCGQLAPHTPVSRAYFWTPGAPNHWKTVFRGFPSFRRSVFSFFLLFLFYSSLF